LLAGILLFFFLWPKGGDNVQLLTGPVQPLGEIGIEGESTIEWSVDLSLEQRLSPLARRVRPRIMLTWSAATASTFSVGLHELTTIAKEVRPRILVAWATFSTSVSPQVAESELIGETTGVDPRILFDAAATTAAPHLGGWTSLGAEASVVSPRILFGSAALSTLDLAFQTAPAELETFFSAPRVLLDASGLGSPVELEGPPELPEK